MTEAELIARQAKQIAELEEHVSDLTLRTNRAILHIVCIGGPLNDNKLQFTNEQLKVFSSILAELED